MVLISFPTSQLLVPFTPYCCTDQRVYSTPEHERLDAQMRAFAEVMGGKTFHAPASPHFPKHPKKVVDIGCGTGIFTAQLGRLFPSAQVIGVDLSPVPVDRHGQLPNVKYLQGSVADLLEKGELEAGSFDYVFSRLILLGIVDWETHIRDVVMKLLAPGGCTEMQEYDAMIRAGGTGQLGVEYGTELGAEWEWFKLWLADTEAIGLDLRIGLHLNQLLVGAGADGIGEDVYEIPHAGPPSAQGTTDEYWATVVETYWGVVVKSSGERHPPEFLEKMRKSYDETFVANLKDLFCSLHVVFGHKPED